MTQKATYSAEGSFGAWLKQHRKALDLTQDELAREVGCATSSLRKFEADTLRPSRIIAERLVQRLGAAPKEIPALVNWARGVAPLDNAPAPEVIDAPLSRGASVPRLYPPLTPLVGRDQAQETVRDLLIQEHVRLLTLTGPGGSGKTSLARTVASQLQDSFTDGAVFVDLSTIHEPILVTPTISSALGINAGNTLNPLDTLADALRERQLLLVLDNFEQLLSVAPQVGALLSRAPRVKILATSRAPLRIAGEQVWPVPPLDYAPTSRVTSAVHDWRDLARTPAVQLFVRRVQAINPSFQLTAPVAPVVAELCARLDGLPLAIELAAARGNVLTPAAMLVRLSDSFALLGAKARDLPDRQQTLRATLDWSYQLLPTAAQHLFARLGVFAGGFTLEAVQAVVDQAPHTIDTFDMLQTLVDHSLVFMAAPDTTADAPRYGLLQTIRDYACERLRTDGDEHDARGRHAQHYLRLAESVEDALSGPDQREALTRLEREHDNFRAALHWALETGATEQALRLAGALAQFWTIRGYRSEGRQWLERAIAASQQPSTPHTNIEPTAIPMQPATIPDVVWAKALQGAGQLAQAQEDDRRAAALFAVSLELYRKLGDQPRTALLLNHLGDIALDQGDYAAAEASFTQGLALARAAAKPNVAAVLLGSLGGVAEERGDSQAARTYYEQSLALRREIGDWRGMARSLTALGRIALHAGDTEQAETLLTNALQLARSVEDQGNIAWIVYSLGYIRLRQRNAREAAAYFGECTALNVRLGFEHGVALGLLGLATIVRALQPANATLLAHTLGAVAARHERLAALMWPGERATYDEYATHARQVLGPTAFDLAWTEGRGMSVEQTIIQVRDGVMQIDTLGISPNIAPPSV